MRKRKATKKLMKKSYPVKGVLPRGRRGKCHCCYHIGTSTRGLLKAELRREIEEAA